MKSMKDYLKNKLSSSFGYGLGDESIESIERQQHREARRKKDKPPTLRDIPKLTKDILVVTAATVSPSPTTTSASSSSLSEFTPSSTASQQSAIVDNVVAIAAAKKLYELCDVGHKANREPMVASGKYDVLGPLTQCLLHENATNTNTNSRNSSSNNNSISESNDTNSASFVNKEPKLNNNDNVGDNNTPVWASKENIDSRSTVNHDDSNNNNYNNTETKIIKQKKKRVVYRQKDEKLHFVCLTLNNLSIPHDNKKVMVTERGARKLIGNLCKVIASGKKEAYLCCIVLMNLSFYEPGLPIIGQFSPSSSSSTSSAIGGVGRRMKPKRKLPPLENPDSLLRILQDLISTVERGTSDYRWAFGLLANLSKHPENALLIGLTGIPRMAIDNLRHCSSCTVSSSLPVKSASSSTSSATKAKTTDVSMPAWQTNSLEDFSLYFLLHLAESCPSNSLKNALDVIMPIMNCEETAIRTHNHDSDEPTRNNNNNNNSIKHDDKQTNTTVDKTMDHTTTHNHQNGIQSLKATMICAFLGLEWDRFPDHGVIAAGAVSELMGNTFERVGKKHMYCDNDFGLRTAVAAYAALAKAASKADAKVTPSAPSIHNTDVATNSINSDIAANDAVSTCTNEKVVARADDNKDLSSQANPGAVDDSPSSVDDKGGLGADDKSNTQSEIDGSINPDTDTSTATNTVLAADTAPAAAVTVAATASSSCVHTKVMALPTSVALLFQIINAIALHGGEDDTKNDNYETYHWDIKAGDLAVTAVMYLLPALLEGEKQKYQQNQSSLGTQQACADLSKVFVFFSKKTNSISVKARAMEIAEKFTESSADGKSLPLLEAAYDLSRTWSTHRIQKNFL